MCRGRRPPCLVCRRAFVAAMMLCDYPGHLRCPPTRLSISYFGARLTFNSQHEAVEVRVRRARAVSVRTSLRVAEDLAAISRIAEIVQALQSALDYAAMRTTSPFD